MKIHMKGRNRELKQWSLIFLVPCISLEKWDLSVWKANHFSQSLALTVTQSEPLFCAQGAHLAVFRTGCFCCSLPCFLATSCVVTGQYILLHWFDWGRNHSTVWFKWLIQSHKSGLCEPGLGFESSILNAMLCAKPHDVPIYHLTYLNHTDNSFFNTLVICHLSCHFH